MSGLVPGFIAYQYRRHSSCGLFAGGTLLFDVSGFTPLTEKLSEQGHQGAEVLSEILNSLFSPKVLKLIRASRGFVAGFAGDSFTVIVPETEAAKLEQLGTEIMQILTAAGGKLTIPGRTGLSFKAGISSGTIEWGIVGDSRKAWYFGGAAVIAANRVAGSAVPGQVLLADRSAGAETVSGFPGVPVVRSSRKTDEAFFPAILSGASRPGEFRRVFCVFVSFLSSDSRHTEDFSEAAASVLKKAERFGGYFNGIHFDGTGHYMLVLFGAPWSFENDGTRAVKFAQELHRETPGTVRAAISSGMVYAGTMGFSARNTYTVLGRQVNTAARIMRYSSEPGIFATQELIENLPDSSGAVSYSRVFLKGTSGLQAIAEIPTGYAVEQIHRFDKQFIGRETQLTQILEASAALHKGLNAGCILVSGQAGIGKSHLIYEAGTLLCERGCRRIVLQCSDITSLSFGPFRSFLRKLFHQIETESKEDNRAAFKTAWMELMKKLESIPLDPSLLHELDRTVSMLQALLGIAGKDSLFYKLETKSRYENTILALRTLFSALAGIKPVLLVVEDYHWIDTASAETVSHLSRLSSSVPVLMILSSRPDDEGSVSVAGLNSQRLCHIRLEPLEAARLNDFVKSVTGKQPDSALEAFLKDRTALNPFFIEQYLKYLEEVGGIRDVHDRLSLVVKPNSIPGGISSILQARLDRLSPELRRLVLMASVLGSEFNVPILSEMASGENIRNLLDSGTSVRVWSDVSQMVYVFRHALLRDAAYGMQLSSSLRKTHAMAASAIEKLFPDRETFFPDLAYHFEKSGNIVRSMNYLEKAAEASRAGYNLEETVGYQRKLLGFLGKTEFRNRGKECAILQSAAANLSVLSRWKEAVVLTEKAEIVAIEQEDSNALGEVLGFRSWLKTQQGFLAEASLLNDRAIEVLKTAGDMESLVRVLGHRGAISFRKADYNRAEEILLETLDILGDINNPRESVKCTTNLGCIYKDRGENSKAEEFFERALKIVREQNYLEAFPVILGNRGTLYRNLGKFDKAIEDYEQSISISQQIGDRKTISSGLGGLALIKYDLGEFQEAVRMYMEQLDIAIDLNFALGQAEAHGYLGCCFEELNNFEKAEEHYDRCIDISREIESSYYAGIFLVLKAAMLFELHRFNEAEILNAEGLDICRRIGIAEMIFSGELLVERLKIQRATDTAGIQEGIANIRELLDRDTNPDSRAMISHRLWKIVTELPVAVQEDVNVENIHSTALGFVLSAFENNPGYSNRQMLAELKVET